MTHCYWIYRWWIHDICQSSLLSVILPIPLTALIQACLTHFSPQLACGLSNCGIAHWPSLLRNTASHRQAHRRKEYGDETDPDVLKFLEDISPLNNADKISAPLNIMQGENDSRVPVEEAIRMWEIVKKRGIHTELIIGEKEGHGMSGHYPTRTSDTE